MTDLRENTDPVCLADVLEEVAEELYRGWSWRAKIRWWWATACLTVTILWRGRA